MGFSKFTPQSFAIFASLTQINISIPDTGVHPGESAEEKVSLSERFGVWLSFYPFDQDEYLAIVDHWLAHFGCTPRDITAARPAALTWTIERGSRSGRVAWQFARDHAGKMGKSLRVAPAQPAKKPAYYIFQFVMTLLNSLVK